jgi:hypothetical protein
MNRAMLRGAAVALVLSGAVACSEGTTEPVVENVPLDEALSQVTAPMAPAGIAGTSGLSVPGIVPSNCTYVASSQSFTCPARTMNGITASHTYQLLDANGTPQSAYGPAVVSIRVSNEMSGTVTPPAIPGAPMALNPITISRRETMTVQGLARNAERRINGTGTSQLSTSLNLNGTNAPMTVAGADTVNNLVLPAVSSGTQPGFPLSGSTIHVERVTMGGLSPLTQTVRIVTTYNGTSSVTVSITADGVTKTCTVNLAQRPPAIPAC